MRVEESGVDAVVKRSGAHAEGEREEREEGREGGNGRCYEAQRRARSREAIREAGREVEVEIDAVLRHNGMHAAGRREVQQKGRGGTNRRCGEAPTEGRKSEQQGGRQRAEMDAILRCSGMHMEWR
jgi:hypothetical protein